jgi:hypothetical protein
MDRKIEPRLGEKTERAERLDRDRISELGWAQANTKRYE